MNILLIGSGGREHAIAHKISQSRLLERLYIAPGNGGTAVEGENVPLNIMDFNQINDFVADKEIDMVVVGPEGPLAEGITDFLKTHAKNNKLRIIGPSKDGALLESSKDFSKRYMLKYGIPTAGYSSFTKDSLDDGYAFIDTLPSPYVLKADGLAAGKGVLIIEDKEEAKRQLKEMLVEEKFGTSSDTVVIEEYLKGIELSVFILTDGKEYLILPEAKDYKRIGEHDTGPNTGGMGSVSPVPFADAAFMKKVEDRIIKPTVKGLAEEHIDYTGFIFIGLMNCNGDPYVIEYNCRMGDPETESVFPRINSDILDVFNKVCDGKIASIALDINPATAATVMLVSEGYPGKYDKGMAISIKADKNAIIYHAGTKINDDAVLVANGGRVIAATAFGDSVSDAFNNAYKVAGSIIFDKKYYRRDLGQDLTKKC